CRGARGAKLFEPSGSAVNSSLLAAYTSQRVSTATVIRQIGMARDHRQNDRLDVRSYGSGKGSTPNTRPNGLYCRLPRSSNRTCRPEDSIVRITESGNRRDSRRTRLTTHSTVLSTVAAGFLKLRMSSICCDAPSSRRSSRTPNKNSALFEIRTTSPPAGPSLTRERLAKKVAC